MQRTSFNTAANRIALLSIGIVALSWLLAKLGSPYQFLALVGIVSAGVLLLIEAAILHRGIRHAQRERERVRTLDRETEGKNSGLTIETDFAHSALQGTGILCSVDFRLVCESRRVESCKSVVAHF